MIITVLIPYFILISLFLGAAIGTVSTYSVVRKWSLLGDIMSHAALPGIVYMFLFIKTGNIPLLLLGGACSSLMSVLLSFYLQKKHIFPKDSAFAVVLSWFFSIGIIGMTIIQKQSITGQSLINNFIFGNIIMCSNRYIIYYIPLFLVIICTFFFSYKIQQIIGFDHIYAEFSYSFIKFWEIVYLLLSICTIVIGLQAIGILLMGALIIAPGTAARLLTDSYRTMMIYSIIITIASFSCGIGITIVLPTIPTGPVIALIPIIFCLFIGFAWLCRNIFKGLLWVCHAFTHGKSTISE